MNFIHKLNKILGPDWIDIEDPDTIAILLNQYVELSQYSLDLIQAIKTLLTIDTPWINIGVFENVVDALNQQPVLPTILTKPPIEDIMYAVHIMTTIQPNIKFSEDVKKYIAEIAKDNQLIAVPPPLAFINKYIDSPYPELQKDIIDYIVRDKNINFNNVEWDISIPSIQILKLEAIKIAYQNKLKADEILS